MSVAAQAKYRDQYVALFERRQSFLRQAVVSDTINQGGTEYFLVAGNAGEANIRGADGKIPNSDDTQSQIAVVLAEAHKKILRTGFDIFRAQGNQLEIMRNSGLASINRKMDGIIIDALGTGSVSLGAIGTMSKTVANKIVTKLLNAHAGEDDDDLYCIVTPACYAYMTDITSFANANYSNTGGMMQDGVPQIGRWKRWMRINWAEHTGLSGVGTSAAVCLAWHKNAIGHAIGPGTVTAAIARNEEEDYSYARHSVYHGAALLQNSGVVKFTHDDSGIS